MKYDSARMSLHYLFSGSCWSIKRTRCQFLAAMQHDKCLFAVLVCVFSQTVLWQPFVCRLAMAGQIIYRVHVSNIYICTYIYVYTYTLALAIAIWVFVALIAGNLHCNHYVYSCNKKKININ